MNQNSIDWKTRKHNKLRTNHEGIGVKSAKQATSSNYKIQLAQRKKIMKRNLSLSLDFDVERFDPGGEKSGEAFAAEDVETVEARRCEVIEASPLLDHAYAGLVHARTQHTIRVPHDRNESSRLVSFQSIFSIERENLKSWVWKLDMWISKRA